MSGLILEIKSMRAVEQKSTRKSSKRALLGALKTTHQSFHLAREGTNQHHRKGYPLFEFQLHNIWCAPLPLYVCILLQKSGLHTKG